MKKTYCDKCGKIAKGAINELKFDLVNESGLAAQLVIQYSETDLEHVCEKCIRAIVVETLK